MKRACQELWFELTAVGLQTRHTEAGQDSPSHHVPWQPWGDGHMQPFLGHAGFGKMAQTKAWNRK